MPHHGQCFQQYFHFFIYLGFNVTFNTLYRSYQRMASCMGRANQYIQLVRVLYCKLPTNGKQLSAFPLEVRPGIELRFQRWEARVLPFCHCAPPPPQAIFLNVSYCEKLEKTPLTVNIHKFCVLSMCRSYSHLLFIYVLQLLYIFWYIRQSPYMLRLKCKF